MDGNTNDDRDGKDECILMLAERLYICSRLLTRAAERLGWDSAEVRELVEQLRDTTRRDVHASVQ